MPGLMEKPNYILAKTVLSKKEPFTLKELKEELATMGVREWDLEELGHIMCYFRDRGIIEEYDDETYSLSILVG